MEEITENLLDRGFLTDSDKWALLNKMDKNGVENGKTTQGPRS